MRKIWAKTSDDECTLDSYKFPKTNWHSICLKQFVSINGKHRFFCRHWEIHFIAPSILLFMTAFTFTVFILTIFHDLSKKWKIICLIEVILFLAFYLINYFESMCMDPGFLPYFWPVLKPADRKFWYNWKEQLTYLAIDAEQFKIAASSPFNDSPQTQMQNINSNQFQQQITNNSNESNVYDQASLEINSNINVNEINQINNDSILNVEENVEENIDNTNNISTTQDISQPNANTTSKLHFASFSKTSGRFIIRADHICGWIANWVGKRNHKQFILFNLYAGIFFLSLLLWRFAPKRSGTKPLKNRSKTLYNLDIAAIVFEVILVIILIPFFIDQMINLSKGKTQLQLMKEYRRNNNNNTLKNNDKKTSCMYEMRQVCGDGNLFCWICPTPAFGKDLYIEGYS